MDAARCNARRRWRDCVRPRRVGLRHEGHVIALHRLHEALRHAVTLWAAHRRRQWLQADIGGEGAGLLGDVARAVIRKPFDFRWRLQGVAKAMYCKWVTVSGVLGGCSTYTFLGTDSCLATELARAVASITRSPQPARNGPLPCQFERRFPLRHIAESDPAKHRSSTALLDQQLSARHRRGVTPVRRANVLVKWLGSAKPHKSEIMFRGMGDVRRYFLASSTR